MQRKVHKGLQKKASAMICLLLIASQVYALYPVHDSPAAVQRVSQWMTAIDDLYTGYDHTMQLMQQLEQSYKSLQHSIDQAKNWQFDDIHWDGDFDIRDELNQAYASVNRQLNNIANIKYQLNDRQFKIGKGSYTIANIFGLVPWNSFQDMDDTWFQGKTADHALEDWLSDTFNDPLKNVYNDLTKDMSDEEVDQALRKHGISAGAQDVVESTIKWVQEDIAYIMANASKSADTMEKEQNEIDEVVNSIIKPEEGADQTSKQIAQKQTLQIRDIQMSLRRLNDGIMKAAELYAQSRQEQWIRMREAEKHTYATAEETGAKDITAVVDSTWIDSPVMDAIDYFSNTFWYFVGVARVLGIIIAIFAIFWTCIQIAFGTMSIQKAIVGTICKWCLFIAILSLYPAMCKGLLRFALSMGQEASGGTMSYLTTQLGNYMNTLSAAADQEVTDLQNIISADNDDKTFCEYVEEQYMTGTAADYLTGSAYDKQFNAMKKQAKKEAKKKLESYMNGHPNHVQRTVAALRSVLKPVDSESHGTRYNMDSKYKIDLSMKDSNGKDTGYLSPAAMMRVAVLTASVMWERQWTETETVTDSSGDKKVKARDTGGLLGKVFPLRKVFQFIICLFCVICIVASMAFTLCQYCMAAIEWSVISAFSIVVVPCLLWDGLKDMANKILPCMLAQAVKLTLITMCMLFSVYCYFNMFCGTIVNGDITISTLAYVFFTCLITFALTQQAPKLATTLLTGQPQLSMGELMGAAMTVAGGVRVGQQSAQFIREAAPAAARAGMNRLGDAAAIVGAGRAAYGEASSGGGLRGAATGAMAASAAAAMAAGGRFGQHFSSSLSRAAHSGMHGSGSMGGSAGENRFGHFDNNVTNPESAMAYGEAGKNVYRPEDINKDGTPKESARPVGKQAYTASEYLSAQYASGAKNSTDIGRDFIPPPHRTARHAHIPATSNYSGLDYKPPKMLPPPKM